MLEEDDFNLEAGKFKDAHQLFDKMLQLKFQDANYQPVSFCHGHHLEIKCSS
ncbi:hypothetical protein HanIR_Chr10g0464701 [Helianthus annuus]|nr:hypothetical protein HanIR_Chr10g0464701 [Helianthus annuus]